MLVTDGAGLPLAVHLDSARFHEITLAQTVLDKVAVRTKAGRIRKRPDQLVADKAYDARSLRKYLRNKGVKPCIPERKRSATDQFRRRCGRPRATDSSAYRQRWRIERTFAWLNHFKRLVVRYENILTVYQGFFHIACLLICLRALLK